MRRFLSAPRIPVRQDSITLTGFVIMVALAIVMAAAWVPGSLQADEGMWLLNELKNCPVDSWHARGLQLDIKDIYDPKNPAVADAIVRLGGGTASFVSFDGLLVTNHHVAFGALQRISSVESNLMEEGFIARTRAEEVHAPGYQAFVLKEIKDVTKKVLGSVNDKMTDKERYDKIEEQNKIIVKKAEKGKDIRCEVRSFFGGMQYFLYTYFKIKDIRIVYAPPGTIGQYGGEIDNWMWPRHTGDFSFMRAYVGPDGKSAEYSEENVPFHPEKYLAFSTGPLKQDDITMVLGYPGRTMRYRSSYSIDHAVNRNYPMMIKRFKEVIDILKSESEKDEKVGVKVAGLLSGLENGYKNNQGMLEGLKKANLLAKKQKEESDLIRFLQANPKLEKKYGTVLDEIKAQYDDYLTYWEKSSILGWMSFGPAILQSALTVHRWTEAQEKKDMDRDPGYMERDEEDRRRGLRMAEMRYAESSDKAVLKYLMTLAADCPRGKRITAVTEVCGGLSGAAAADKIDAFVDKLYADTKVTDLDMRLEMFDMKKDDLRALNDPMVEFAARLETERKAMEEKTEAFGGALQKLRPRLMEMRKAYGGELVYPDANSTMRLSIGQIKGYSPGDAVHYDPMTTLTGVMEKFTGEDPFELPTDLIALYEAKDFGKYADPVTRDIPICFLSTNDGTGGNSGSPVLNGRGEIIGLLFDGNYESMSADYQFIPKLTRSINVDSRYVLFILEKFAKADELLEELTIH